jgi:hypothetical protein
MTVRIAAWATDRDSHEILMHNLVFQHYGQEIDAKNLDQIASRFVG